MRMDWSLSSSTVELKDTVDFDDAVRASNAANGVAQKIGYVPNDSFLPHFILLY